MQWSAKQQEAILDRGKNLLVSAAAGSGKTAVLVERIKGLLLSDGVSLSEMLIVTFSNAAAAEMREKINAALSAEMEQKDCPPQRQRFLRSQLNSIHKANISTFHAFAMEVIRRYFYLIDAEPSFRICDEGQKAILQDQAMEQLFQQEFEEKRPDFIRFLDWYATGKSEQDVKDMILYVHNFIQSMPDPLSWLSQSAKSLAADEQEFCQSEAYRYMVDQVEQQLQLVCRYCRKVYDRLEEEGIATLLPKAQADLDMTERCLAEVTSRGIAGLTGDGTAGVSTPQKFQVFTAGKADKEAYGVIREEITAMRDRAKELWGEVHKTYGAVSLSQQVEAMNATAWAAEELAGLTEKFDQLYCQRKQEKGLLDFSDIEHYALRILRKEEAAAEYRKAFAYIFVDEYQDSNVIQEELIGCIARENNRFMVGDVKQSIYKFRLAEPEIFLHKYEQYKREESSDCTSKKIDLNLNFRCKGNIIQTTNQIFQAVMTKQSTGITYDEDAALHKGLDYCGELDYPTMLHIVDVKSGIEDVDSQIAELATAEVEAMQAARLIHNAIGMPVYDCKKQMVRPLRKRDIVILLRGVKSYGDLYTKALMEQGIESFMDNSDGYFDTLEIQIFLNLLRVVDNKRQDVALLSVLRSPIFGFSISQLAEIRARHRDGSYFDALQWAAQQWEECGSNSDASDSADGNNRDASDSADTSDSPDASDSACTGDCGSGGADDHKRWQSLAYRCSDVLARLRLWREKASFMPLSSFLQMLIGETGYGSYVGAIAGGSQRLANVNAMVDKAIQYEAASGKGLFGFIRYIEALQKGKVKTGQVKMLGENDDVVRIMTIHKSKGLEFPFVLIGGLGRAFNRRRETAKVACHKDLGLGMRLVMAEEHAYKKTLIKQLIDQKLQQDDMAEEIRILYVGFTRAMDRLLLLASVKDSDRFREQEARYLPEDSRAAGCYLDLIFPWVSGPAVQVSYSDRSLLASQKQEDDRRREDVGLRLMTGFEDSGCEPWEREEIHRRLTFAYQDSGRNQLKTKYTVSELASRWRATEMAEMQQADRAEIQQVDKAEMQQADKAEMQQVDNAEIRQVDKAEIQQTDMADRTAAAGQIGEQISWLAGQGTIVGGALEDVPEEASSTEPMAGITPADGAESTGTAPTDGAESTGTAPTQSGWRDAFSVIPAFLEAKKMTAADRGTIYHRVMECLPFDHQWSTVQVREFVQEMVKKELLTKEEARLVHSGRISAFFRSPLGRRVVAAQNKRKEVSFNLKQEMDGLPITVQGTIDCYFQEEDGFVLLDYKSNFIDDRQEEEEVRRVAGWYRPQLLLYREALEKITGCHVKQMYLYLFSAGKAVEIFDDAAVVE